MVIDRLHLYYDMQLVTFGINKDKNLIIQFPVFVQPYTQQPLILVSIRNSTGSHVIDQNTEAQCYTHLQVYKPYIALTFWNLHLHQTGRTKNLQKNWLWILLCKELFVVKHKSRYSCESTIYFNHRCWNYKRKL